MEKSDIMDQLCFMYMHRFTFANKSLISKDIPEHLKNLPDSEKLILYNNNSKGIIDNKFFTWALNNNIPFDLVKWFIKDFSKQTDNEILWMMDALFNQYTFYLDESNNCVKFRFKDTLGNTNAKWYNDFVLSGIVFEGNVYPIDIDELFDKFELQANIIDAKLGHIANYNGDDVNRFIGILNSRKVSVLLETLLITDKIYIHWSTENLLYYSLVDIVDSVLEIPFFQDEVKNVLYNKALNSENSLLVLLSKFDYPNIKNKEVPEFCNQFINWLERCEVENEEEEFAFELLRQGFKTSLKKNDLIFLHDNKDKLLIEDFIPVYALRISNFLNSSLHFDKCGIVESNIDMFVNIFCNNKIPHYDFNDSENNKWVQLSDMVSGITGALMTYINTHDIMSIETDISLFNETQNKNLKMFLELRNKSSNKNKYFDHMSKNSLQIQRIRYLMDKYIENGSNIK